MNKSKNDPQNTGSQLVIEEPEHKVDKVVVKCSGGQENQEGKRRKLPKIKIPAKIWQNRRQQNPAHTAGENQQNTTIIRPIHLNKDGHCVSTTVRSKFLCLAKIQIFFLFLFIARITQTASMFYSLCYMFYLLRFESCFRDRISS